LFGRFVFPFLQRLLFATFSLSATLIVCESGTDMDTRRVLADATSFNDLVGFLGIIEDLKLCHG
jgi:hypothetical protein